MGTLPRPPGEITSGRIDYRGANLLVDPTEHECVKGEEMSMIFRDPTTYPSPVYSVGSVMADVATYSGSNDASWLDIARSLLGQRGNKKKVRERSTELLGRMRVSDPEGILEKYPVELSGGMRQRIITVMVLINEPTFLLADEPTTALDVTVQDQILDLLREHVEERDLPMLYIMHNLGVARKVADKIYIMCVGEVVEVGDTEELFNAPLHPYTRGLLDSIPKLTGLDGNGIGGQVPDYTDPSQGYQFHLRCPAAIDGVCDAEPPESPAIEGDDSDRRVTCHLYGNEMTLNNAVAVAADESTYADEPSAQQSTVEAGSEQ